MSTMFGIQTDYQNNPNDPTMQRALAAMKPSAFMQTMANIVLPLLPWGRKFLTTKTGGQIFFKEMLDLTGLAQEVVDIKRRGESDRKVRFTILNTKVYWRNARFNFDNTLQRRLNDLCLTRNQCRPFVEALGGVGGGGTSCSVVRKCS